MRISLWSAAVVAALVGYGSTIALVLAAATAVGADPAQTASWIFAICLAKAAGTAILSSWHRIPVVLAWSTPGAALIAASSGISIQQAVGAFLCVAALVAATGAIRPLGRLVAAIPDGIAAAMLAGVLVPFCVKGAASMAMLPSLVLPMLLTFLIVRLWNPAIAVLTALAMGLILAFGLGHAQLPILPNILPHPQFITPLFDPGTLIGLALPLYLVTMASQNLPGFATMRAAGFEPPVRSALGVSGIISAITACFGAHTVNMAAITAAICMGDDVHPDRSQRWKVGLAYAAVWVALALLGPAIIAALAALPPALMAALVGLALLGPLTGALTTAFSHPDQRFAAAATLTTTASGFAAFGIGAAFWGLVAGLTIHAMESAATRLRRR
jgi:benzoate membrane transport protein